ncbi:hypothetical protein RRR72_003822 [Citrobacter freundii]|uniref:Uncharacterized protein n=1 Tax=Citrobacter portucalensis TaxID=1639133 RepID=A0AAW5WBS7_9ENTR|nr:MULTISPECIES: hypothetical protein [Citrobacter freundii complex]ELJ2049641.1 hypothetical protein [Citrobacter freundii]MCX9003612.1 hypothetical protein [Citrobacter portucalensis]MCX9022910.1 hypothetical protein [Citrobacter portucalensis]QMN59851.1 hypothetical protein HVW68_18130 [Citrobacter freundii]
MNKSDTQDITLTLDRALYIASIQAHIDLEKLLADAIRDELPRLAAKRQQSLEEFINSETFKELLKLWGKD